jgi:hypothetical protein
MVLITSISYFILSNPALLAGLLAAGLAQPLGNGAAAINAVGQVFFFGGLIGAGIAAKFERNMGGVVISLIIAMVGGLAWAYVSTVFQAGGQGTNLQLGQLQ